MIPPLQPLLQISYLISKNEVSREDRFWYNAGERGLDFSDNNFWNGIFEEDKILNKNT